MQAQYTSLDVPRDWYFPPKLKRLETSIQDARAEARHQCAIHGPVSAECAVAWDTVEELLSELAHERIKHPPRSGFEQYVAEFPEAEEARMYDV